MGRTMYFFTTVALSAFWITGCMNGTGPADTNAYNRMGAGVYEDQQAEAITQDVAGIAMGATAASNGGLSKQASGELTILWQAWEYSDGWWTRNGNVDGSDASGNTLSIQGGDSVQFVFGGQVIQSPLQMVGLSADARRHGSIQVLLPTLGEALLTADYGLQASVSIEGADTVLTLSGTGDRYVMVRNADNTERVEIEGEAVATGVKCRYENGSWSKPYAGTVTITGPYKQYDITYHGDTATIVITGATSQVPTRTVTVQITVD